MDGDQTAQLIASVGFLVLVASSLVARRLPLGQTLRMVLGWVLIFAIVLVGYSFRDELGTVANRVLGDLRGERGTTVGDTLRVPMAEDGHFWVRASVNGYEARFLIDSGATRTSLSVATARGAGLTIDESGFPVVLNTANGQVEARRTRIERMSVGPIVATDLAALVAPSFGETNVIGMNFLSSLESWRVEGSTLILEPRRSGATS